jgi:hypothetical protein
VCVFDRIPNLVAPVLFNMLNQFFVFFLAVDD